MKKFIIISTVLLLLAGGAFGYSMYRYIQANGGDKSEAAEETSVSAKPAEAVTKDSTPAADQAADTSSGKDVFADGQSKASEYVAQMTTEQMVGQLVLGVCTDTASAASEMNQYSLAGMLFESGNFQGMTAEEISAAMLSVKSEAQIKPILAAQEEGGSYTTLSDLSPYGEYDFDPPRVEFDANGLQGVEKAEDSKAALLKSAGFTMNLSPVVDMASSYDQLMYSRSITDDVEVVSKFAEYASKIVQAQKGISVTLSHFPGYGTVSAYSTDDETGVIVDDRDAASIREKDYTPFKKGAAAGAHFVMMSNAVVKNIDAAHTAALSPTLHSELRNTVGFNGIIITDILDDADYSAYADGKKVAVQAVLAGNDLILVRDYATAYNDILAAVKDGTITEAQLKAACTRVIAYKYTVGIMK